MAGSSSDDGTTSPGDGGPFSGMPDRSDALSMVGHFYRGEMERTVGWRTRLDQTTNWAVVLMAAILTFVFSSEDNPHYVLLIGILGVVAFLVIESQRYQEYDAWRYRVRLLQREFFADLLGPDAPSAGEWQEDLREDLHKPSLVVSRLGAMGHRLKRVYLFLLTVLVTTWLLRISVFDPERTWLETAAIAEVPGSVVVGLVLGLYLGLAVLALWSALADRMREFREAPISGE
jgi:uncharacterized membrane protein